MLKREIRVQKMALWDVSTIIIPVYEIIIVKILSIIKINIFFFLLYDYQ